MCACSAAVRPPSCCLLVRTQHSNLSHALLSLAPQVRQALAKVPDEVMSKYYGCGSPLPMGIEGLR